MMYFGREHYILPFSHDENVHGKATILQKMYGEYEDKFPQGRALYLYMAIHPGKMLDFMGNEFGQLREYDECLAQMQQVNKELKAINQEMEKLMSETIAPEVTKLSEEGVAALQKLQQENTEKLEALGQQYTAKLEELQQSTGVLDELQKHVDEKLSTTEENVHKECVKVYRNVQAVVVEENEKQTEAIAAKVKENLGGTGCLPLRATSRSTRLMRKYRPNATALSKSSSLITDWIPQSNLKR